MIVLGNISNVIGKAKSGGIATEVIANDQFTGSVANFTGRVPDTVGAVAWTGTTAGYSVNGSGLAGTTATSFDVVFINVGVADIKYVIKYNTVDGFIRLFVNSDGNASSHSGYQIFVSTSNVTLTRLVSGAGTNVAAFNGTVASNALLEVYLRGDNVRIDVDGATRIDYTESNRQFKANTRHGFRGAGTASSTGLDFIRMERIL